MCSDEHECYYKMESSSVFKYEFEYEREKKCNTFFLFAFSFMQLFLLNNEFESPKIF